VLKSKGETRTITLVEQNDADLVRQTLCGNTSAYNGLVMRYQRQVYNLAYRMLGNAEDAGDLVQDTFLRAYGARSALSLDVELEEGREPAADSRSCGPEELAIRDSVQEVVQRAISNLPEKYRVVVVMRHLQDMSVEEIANVLEMPTGTVKTHLFRAREMLRGRLRSVLEMETDGK